MATKARSILITGTTSGLGRALLEHYSRGDARVISVNRRRIPELELQYPAVRFECVDVRNSEQVEALMGELAASAELPDIFILNAGINRIDNDEWFELAAYQSVIDTNLYGVLNFIQPLTRLPAGGAKRHVVAISSMVNYVGNPYGLGYYTSKRALTACFDVWSKMYTGTDLSFQQVMLGPIRSEIYTMADQFPAWMVRIRKLFSASPGGAAHAVARFAATRRKKLFYPWKGLPLYLGMWLCRSLVPGFFQGRKTLRGKARRRAGQQRGAHEER